ncbi:MAG: polysaccharide biosynthesis C-terminal domain-containing protein [Brumimicrobium sp.]|nr:polysaccharide biosynthesis C-terminal domain-containing protein [Brumimicrobium sp.]MCO5269975.1 polysaccharide biosynthesis C-terminal domain-containing protein [Brumimicrobium sp.]
MLKKIIASIFSKGITAISNLLILLISAKYLGAYGRGEMAIVVLGISIVGIFQSIFSGPSLSYLIPRYSFFRLILSALLWNILISLTLPFILAYSGLFPIEYLYDLLLLTILLSSISIFQYIFIGTEKIHPYNLIEIIKASTTAFFLYWFIVHQGNATIQAVIESLYAAYIISFIFAIIFAVWVLRKKKFNTTNERGLFYKFLKIGFQMQLNNISQMINYRFCYYLVEKFLGLASLGVFSVATSLIEGVWVIFNGISLVHYSKSVNLKNIQLQVKLTQHLTKLSFLLTLPAILIIILLPDSFYNWLLGSEFEGLRPIFASMSLGVLLLATFAILNHHFSAVEKNLINVKSSFIGNIVTISIGLLTIQSYGIYAGGIATSIAYLIMFSYLIFRFNKMYHLQINWIFNPKGKLRDLFDFKIYN